VTHDPNIRLPGSSGGEAFPSETPRRGSAETAQSAQGAGFRVITLPLDAAMNNFEIKVKGNQFWMVDATDLDVAANVKYNEVSGQGIPIRKGFALKGIPFNRIYVTSAVQAGKSLTLVTTNIPGSPVEFVNPTADLNDVKILKGNTLRTTTPAIVGNVNGPLYAADPSRLSAIVENISTGTAFVGEDTGFGLFGTGATLNPGDIIVIDQAPGAELRALSAVNCNFRVFEELR